MNTATLGVAVAVAIGVKVIVIALVAARLSIGYDKLLASELQTQTSYTVPPTTAPRPHRPTAHSLIST